MLYDCTVNLPILTIQDKKTKFEEENLENIIRKITRIINTEMHDEANKV